MFERIAEGTFRAKGDKISFGSNVECKYKALPIAGHKKWDN